MLSNLMLCELCKKKIYQKTVYCAYDIKCCSIYCQKSIINLNKLNKKHYYFNQECINKKTIQLLRKYVVKKVMKIREKKQLNRNIYDYLKIYSLLEL